MWWRCEDVRMRRCEDEQMWRWEDVKICRCEDEKMWRWEGVKMRRCEDEKMWRWEDVEMRRCEDEKMWRWEDVKMRRCEDMQMWRWEDVKMRRCEDEKMWRWEDVKMRRWDTDPHYWKNPALRRSREKSHKDIQVRSSDLSTHPPKRVTGSNSRRSRPQRSEPEKKLRVARKRGKLLRIWGSVVMGQAGPNVKLNVKM